MQLGTSAKRTALLLPITSLLFLLPLSGERAMPAAAQAGASPNVAYPLTVGPTRRYLVDQRDRPFLIVGDSPQSMIVNLSVQDAKTYIADRKSFGFNALWVNLLCDKYTAGRADGSTYDHIQPFLKPNDLSTPNPRYFARVDAMIRLASQYGMVVFLDPIETGGWLETLQANGVKKAYAYGRFLGKRYTKFPNIVWMSGNDFQQWSDASLDSLVLAVAKGIRSADPRHLQTVELNYNVSSSSDDPRWRPLLGLNAAYTYSPTYAEVLKDYNGKGLMPIFMVEAGYEFEQNNASFSPGDSRDAAPTGVLEPPERGVGPVLREPLHVAVPPGVEEQPRHARQPADLVPGQAVHRSPVVPTRPGPAAHAADLGLRHLLVDRERRLERLRHRRADPGRQARDRVLADRAHDHDRRVEARGQRGLTLVRPNGRDVHARRGAVAEREH